MFYKVFVPLFIISVFTFFPSNIIGCGGGDDWEYHVTFFNHKVIPDGTYEPFYYSYRFLNDETEPVTTTQVLTQEWQAYFNNAATPKDVETFVFTSPYEELKSLYYYIEKQKPFVAPAAFKNNGVTKYFIKTKNYEALGYLMYAKQIQEVTYDADGWSTPTKNPEKLAKLIKNGSQLYAAAKTEVIKLKYAYQVMRLQFYNTDNAAALNTYDTWVTPNPTQSVLKTLCVALQAGVYYRQGKTTQAALGYTKAFAANKVKTISNYLSFTWCVKNQDFKEAELLAACSNNAERANAKTLLALNSYYKNTNHIFDIFTLDPSNEKLQLLVIKQIQNFERNLYQQPENENQILYTYLTDDVAKNTELKTLANNIEKVAKACTADKKGFYYNALAYTNYLQKNYTAANQNLQKAKSAALTTTLQDQWNLTNILVAINQQKNIDAAFEAKLLPSLKWLAQKITPVGKEVNYANQNLWDVFYVNLFKAVLAPMYQKQGDVVKYLLCLGHPDKATQVYDWRNVAIDALRNKYTAQQATATYNFLKQNNKSDFENFVTAKNTITANEITDYLGTAYLREADYDNAINWLQKESASVVLAKNPFTDLLYDYTNELPTDAKLKTTKLSFAKEMQRLKNLVKTDATNKDKYLYQLATGLYNITYYGYTSEIVTYYRSSVDDNAYGGLLFANATNYQKDYYHCQTAYTNYKAAMDASNDKEFKARCLFMMAKCNQKTERRPSYSNYTNQPYEVYQKAEANYYTNFMRNKHLVEFKKQYSNTSFYQEAASSCTYLAYF
jgi:hypothetical protein